MLVKGTSSSAAETHAFIVENDLDSNVTSAPPKASILSVGVGRTQKDVLEATPLECDWGVVHYRELGSNQGKFLITEVLDFWEEFDGGFIVLVHMSCGI